MRRHSRRIQPRLSGPKVLSHTSDSAALEDDIGLFTAYSETLHHSILRAQNEHEVWFNSIFTAASVAREDKLQARRLEQEHAHLLAEELKKEQKRIRDLKLIEQQARAAEWRERQREEQERIREEEAARQRQRAEQEAARFRAAEEAERRIRERMKECAVCFDENDVDLMVQTPCQHWYCPECLTNGFQAATIPFQCCQQTIPIGLVAERLSSDFIERYESMVLEHNTPNPTYCADSQCGAFIPPSNYHGPDSARCLRCSTDTCRHCRTRDHVGRGCTNDEATEQVKAMGVERGWKLCPSCGTMVEKNEGCLHMTCRPPCGYQFCWNCSGPWRQCQSSCMRML